MSSVLDDMPEAVEMARESNRRSRSNGASPAETPATPEPVVGSVWAAQIAEQEAAGELDGQLTDEAGETPAADEPSTAGEAEPLDRWTETAQTDASVDTHSSSGIGAQSVTSDSGGDLDEGDDGPEERPSGYMDPREDLVDIHRRRLEARLQPIDDDDAWHGVYAITRKDLSEVLMQPLPAPNFNTAVVKLPATVYVTGECPICGIEIEYIGELDSQAVAQGRHRPVDAKMTLKTKPVRHVCYQTRAKLINTPSRPTHQERLPLSSPVAPPADPEPNANEVDFGEEAPDKQDVDPDTSLADEVPDESALIDEVYANQQALDLGSCPYPGCVLAEEHTGDHSIPAPGSIDETDLDDLPF